MYYMFFNIWHLHVCYSDIWVSACFIWSNLEHEQFYLKKKRNFKIKLNTSNKYLACVMYNKQEYELFLGFFSLQ